VGILMMLQQLQTIGEDRTAIVAHLLTMKDLLQFGLHCCRFDTEPVKNNSIILMNLKSVVQLE